MNNNENNANIQNNQEQVATQQEISPNANEQVPKKVS